MVATLGPPPYQTAIAGQQGITTQAWISWFNQLIASLGGSVAPVTNYVTVTAYGAVGDGQTNNIRAFQAAFAENDTVFVPSGNYFVSGPIVIGEHQVLIGEGDSSIISARGTSYDVIQIQGRYGAVTNLQIQGGNAAIRLFAGTNVVECVQNAITDVHIVGPNYGIVLDGYENPNFPCYWNNFFRILIESPKTHGVWLTVTGAGDTPNANKFHSVRVYSHDEPMTGFGFYIEAGRFNNSFIDCEANLWLQASACFVLGAQADTNLFINPYAESLGGLPCFWLQAGSQNTYIQNLLSAAAGPAIYDQSGGKYEAVNAGYPFKNTLLKTTISDLTINLQRDNIPFIDGVTTLNIPAPGIVGTSNSAYLVSAFSGNMTVNLPLAINAPGMSVWLKRTDLSTNTLTVVENGGLGPGPDGLGFVYMNNQNDWLWLKSNGAEWWMVSTNLPLVQSLFIDPSTAETFIPDMTKNVYLVSAFSAAVTFELPNAHQPGSAGKQITIKKTDVSGNLVTITEGNYSTFTGTGPDGGTIILSNEFDWITVFCNGANWFVVAGNIFTKIGVGTTTGLANINLYHGGSPTNAQQGLVASFGGGPTPSAANFYAIGLSKTGYEEVYMGINKNSTTGTLPASCAFITTYNSNGQLALGRGDGSGSPDTADILINSSGNVVLGGSLTVNSAVMLTSTTSFSNGAGSNAGTLLNAPTAGNPTKWVPIDDNGTTRYIPAW